VLRLTYFEEYSAPEIARELNTGEKICRKLVPEQHNVGFVQERDIVNATGGNRMNCRKWIFIIFVSIGAATSAFGQRQVMESMTVTPRPANAPATIGALVQQIGREVRPAVIAVDWTTDSFIIPVAGNAAGSGGTYYRSDVVFNNDRLQDQRIAIGWFAQGQNNCSAQLQYFTLSANSVTVADDFVGQLLGKTGLGALLVVAVTANGLVDENGEIDGYSRIWTPQPGSTGSVSQNFSAIDVNDSLGSVPATLMGLKQSNQFRTNVGIVNMDIAAAHTWTFTSIFNGRTTSLAVPPCSMAQTGAVSGSASGSGNVAFTVKSDGFGFYWSGYGTSTDNVTGDGWVSRAVQ
jgi:hypothetical protein